MVELSPDGPGCYAQGFAGDTFNTAWHLRQVLPGTWQVGYFTAVGKDPLSDAMLAFMRNSGIDTSMTERLPGAVPGLYMIATDATGERSFTYWRGQSAARHLADDRTALAAAIGAATHLYVSGITLAILPPAGRAMLLAEMAGARAAGKTVAFDANLRPALWDSGRVMRDWLARAARTATIALPTWPDEQVLADDANPRALAARYRAAGAAEVVVKAGANAAWIDSDAGQWRVAPTPMRPLDTTGAGDSFNAGYLAARCLGIPPPKAARAGHDLAARVLQVRGALLSEPEYPGGP